MKDQVLSIKQMKYLQELGLDTSDASMVYVEYDNLDRGYEYRLTAVSYKDSGEVHYPVYTFTDILRKLPKPYELHTNGKMYWLTCEFDYETGHDHKVCSKISELEATYQMLCWCVENGYIK